MANEYLKRTPTSTGNRKVFTWSGWVKRSDVIGWQRLFETGTGTTNFTTITWQGDNESLEIMSRTSGSNIIRVQTSAKFRDPSSYCHVVVSINTTSGNSTDRCKIYINGVRITDFSYNTQSSQNYDTFVNGLQTHYLGNAVTLSTAPKTNIFDVFFIDGQALTPEVFGHNKDGRGYISAGSTQATDFRNGQWLPKKPKLIIDEINASGGFGVNGFYLPMNSSNNFGADFHTTPNTILKLKDNLPQPKAEIDGSGDYSGDIRDDLGGLPFPGVVKFDGTGDYLSLASSGDFAWGTGDFTWETWAYSTASDHTIGNNYIFDLGTGNIAAMSFYQNKFNYYNATIGSNGQLGSFPANKWTHIAVSRKNLISYIFIDGILQGSISDTHNYGTTALVAKVGVYAGNNTLGWDGYISNLRILKGTALYTENFTPPTQPLQKTTDTVLLCCNSKTDPTNEETGKTITKNGDVYATTSELTDALVLAIPGVSGGLQNGFGDYSAAIKGSGIAKTVTAIGNAGVSATSSYYGSAMQMGGGANRFTFPAGTDFAPGTGDFTVEGWGYPTGGNDGIYSADYLYSQSVGGQNYFVINFGNNTNTAAGNIAFTMGTGGAGGGGGCFINVTGIIPINQWTHFAIVRDGTTVTVYVNGVAVGVATGVTFDANNTTFVPTLGAYTHTSGSNFFYNGYVQDFRIYKGVAKYKGGFDVPRPYTPVNFANWRAVPDTTANNFCTWNPLSAFDGTQSNGNLTSTTNDLMGTVGVSTGKWYWEIYDTTAVGGGGNVMHHGVSFGNYNRAIGGGFSNAAEGVLNIRMDGVNQSFSGTTITITSNTGTVPTYSNGDIYSIALDLDTGVVRHYRNGSVILTTNFTYNKNTYAIPYTRNNGLSCSANFGQNPTFSGNTTAGTFTDTNGKGLFKYEPPTGFLALCEDNLPTPTVQNPGEHFKTILWTGDGNNGRSITGVGFQPDLVWIKRRNGASDHVLQDSVRGFGPTTKLSSSSTQHENDTDSQGSYGITDPQWGYLNSVDTDGFSLNASTNGDQVNKSTGDPYVAWCWKAGGPAITNTAGTITSQVSANQTAGFSIVSYTGNGTGGSTVGHGLGKTPSFIIVKNRFEITEWLTLHTSVGKTGDTTYGNEEYFMMLLSSTVQRQNYAIDLLFPGNSNSFVVGGSGSRYVNYTNDKYIAYCWAEIEGYSKFGSYVGNGDPDGPFVYTGSRPAFIMTKRIDGISNWNIIDTSRISSNPNDTFLIANGSNTEFSGYPVDILSNGFKIRTTEGGFNTSGGTYIFIAFAESPFQYANSK